jgi:hypothetical protein
LSIATNASTTLPYVGHFPDGRPIFISSGPMRFGERAGRRQMIIYFVKSGGKSGTVAFTASTCRAEQNAPA